MICEQKAILVLDVEILHYLAGASVFVIHCETWGVEINSESWGRAGFVTEIDSEHNDEKFILYKTFIELSC